MKNMRTETGGMTKEMSRRYGHAPARLDTVIALALTAGTAEASCWAAIAAYIRVHDEFPLLTDVSGPSPSVNVGELLAAYAKHHGLERLMRERLGDELLRLRYTLSLLEDT